MSWFPAALVKDLFLMRPEAWRVVRRAHIPAFKCWVGLHDRATRYDMQDTAWKRDGYECSRCRKRMD